MNNGFALGQVKMQKNAIFTLTILAKKCGDGQEMHCTFVDLQEACQWIKIWVCTRKLFKNGI